MSDTPESIPTPRDELSQASDDAAAEKAVAGDAPENEGSATQTETKTPESGGPISLAKIRELRMSQHKTGSNAAPASETKAAESQEKTPAAPQGPAGKASGGKDRPRPRKGGLSERTGVIPTPEPAVAPKIEVPSRRQALSKELEDELEAALSGSDLDKMLVGDSMLQVGKLLDDGQRMQAKVTRAQGEFVFVSLGGPNEGVIPSLQFEEIPEEGTQLEIVVRGYLESEGLYELTVPGSAVEVSDWDDLNEGEVVEAVVTGSNTGGLECKVGAIDGFIPASQAAEYRIENLAELVGQKLLCVVNEANPRRGNLVLSHRAVLEREKAEKREERLASLEVGAAVEGVVRKIMDFGAFVDIGGLDGLLHVSQLSWDRVQHPKEVLEEGQQIQVRVDKIDPQSGKIGLSYRALQENPWSKVEESHPVGSIVHGTVTRIAEFGAFVKIATGVEGLVHVSELAHHRVSSVGNVVSEGQEVDVKVLSIDTDQQRISLSLKGAQAAPAPKEGATDESVDEPAPAPILPKHRGPLKGGTGGPSGGEKFGLKW